MPALTLSGLSEPIGTELFGANILAHRDSLTAEARLGALVDDLGVTALRYPGGSLTEVYFDISDPDASIVSDRDTGETREFIGISDFMAFAEDRDLAVTLVIPTRDQLSEDRDANGDRYAEVDEDALRAFVHDTVTGHYGDAQVQAFEIGNEYWGSGLMSATEYGRVASEIAEIMEDELSQLSGSHPQAAGVDIVVQMGTNFGESALGGNYDAALPAAEILDDLNARYDLDLGDEVIRGNGEVNWIEVNNHIVLSYFDEPAEIDALDAVAAHVYSKEPAMEDQRGLMLNAIDETWGEDARFADLDTYVTEWNQSGQSAVFDREADYGLHQAHEMLNMVEEFAQAGVDQAHVWPMLQNTDNALSTGHSYEALSPSGRFFAMMSETLPGKTMLDFNPADPGETEAVLPNVDVHGFYGEDEMTLYIASTADGPAETLIDIAQLVESVGSVSARRLGVAEGEAPGSNSSTAALEALDPAEVYAEGYITAELDEGEILEVTLSDLRPTAGFSAALSQLEEPDPAEYSFATDEDEIPIEYAASAAHAPEPGANETGVDVQPPDAAVPEAAAAGTDEPATIAGLPLIDIPEEEPAEDDRQYEEIEIEPPLSGIFWALLPLIATLFGF